MKKRPPWKLGGLGEWAMQRKRTNTAVWLPAYGRWQVNVQRDGVRRSFTSSTPGRAGQREANAKADRWLDEGIENDHITVTRLWDLYLQSCKADVGNGRYATLVSFGKVWLLPKYGRLQIGRLTEAHLQTLLDDMGRRGLAHDTISVNRSMLLSFVLTSHICTAVRAEVVIPSFFMRVHLITAL